MEKLVSWYRKLFDTEKAVPLKKINFCMEKAVLTIIQFYYSTARTAISTALPLFP